MPFLLSLIRPRGRIGRAEFWIGLVFHGWILRLLGIREMAVAVAAGVAPWIAGWLGVVLVLADAWMLWCHLARRWHDLGFRAAWTLAVSVPVVGWLFALVMLGFVPALRAGDRYGPPRPLRALFDELAALVTAASWFPASSSPADGASAAAAALPAELAAATLPVEPAVVPSPADRIAAVLVGTSPVVVRRGAAVRGPRRGAAVAVFRRR